MSMFSPSSSCSTDMEAEKDANSLLMELDKGLRSGKVGEQCESIVRFPRLFEKYPFPILINSAFLKLADVFRVGSNLLRQCIFKVAQQSEKHLDKILNVDEFLRRIYAVIHSNDAMARAITLRTLGQVARIISERKNVHHSIVSGLDSHDAVEQEAAIFSAAHFAKQSQSFALSVCGKLEEMMQSLATPINIKLKLIPICQHMHHENQMADTVWRLCTELLPSYPTQGFVVVTLHTLSLLASHTLVHIPQQIELLLKYLETDCRRGVQISALQDLRLLARTAPHMWTQEHIVSLCELGVHTPYAGLLEGILYVLTSLSHRVAVNQFPPLTDERVQEVCQCACYHVKAQVASQGAKLFTKLTIHAVTVVHKNEEEVNTEHLDQCCLVLETLVTVCMCENTEVTLSSLETCLMSMVELCQHCPLVTDRCVDGLMSSLQGQQLDVAFELLLCECLASISSQKLRLMDSLIPDLLVLLYNTRGRPQNQANIKLTVSLMALVLQACVGDELSASTTQALLAHLQLTDCWTAYRTARLAARYGHHALAAEIFKDLNSKVYSEHLCFWLSALKECCLGESCLSSKDTTARVSDFMKHVSQAETHYHNSMAALRAASTPNFPLQFQVQYMSHRTLALQVFSQVVRSCCSFQTSPPPAIATARSMTTGQEIHRCGHVISQLKKCCSELGDLRKKYGQLYKTSFDADKPTLDNIQLLHQSCGLMIHVIESILAKCTSSTPDMVSQIGEACGKSQRSNALDSAPWCRVADQVLEDLATACAHPQATQLALTHQHLSCIKSSAMRLVSLPLFLPRMFFQQLQMTEIKLALTPQPKSTGDILSVHYDTRFTLKVEGVVQHGSRPGIIRSAQQVRVTTHSTQQNKGPMATEEKVGENPSNDLAQTVDMQHDYFSVQFLLAFPVAGLHQVEVSVSVVDTDLGVWETGPTTSITIKSYDEAVQRQQQQQYAAHRQQQRAAALTH